MRFATRANGTADGELILISHDGARCLPLGARWPNLLHAITDWDALLDDAAALSTTLEEGGGESLDHATLLAPLPRTWQWLDGSAFANHGVLMERAFNHPPIETDLPLMYQGMSHRFLAPREDVAFPTEADCIDFEGEFGIVTDDVPMGCSADKAMGHIRLILLINDWSLRAVAPKEMKTGFGWIQAKPACSAAPIAITPDELGDRWRDGRVCLPLRVEINGDWFGHPSGEAMEYGFHELIAHAARTRHLCAGTIIGSGTVSDVDFNRVGSTCISERRAIEMIAQGQPVTPFLRFGDRVRMCAGTDENIFGELHQTVAAYVNVGL
ncbi:fumarylacetoacetate hydrolase family protein [Sphingomonas bisphenolicum]|uniref:2-keto-4-pentenoate hydratase n=1 Tax=Sphingomonas bisphenolicum TaxID=296544 RepID=A0ABM7G7V8_9SPHN|nr:fumarylacetoacetate hydrolase family protein [Sphingomonas bisphenolicum]BBF71693.1 2-keto-4-pentenoate hydratase [Sphingomonas bisphenolicum]